MTNTNQTSSSLIEQITTTQMSSNHNDTSLNPLALPLTGVSRANQLLPFLPFGSSTLWKWANEGKFITPIKLSPTITAWDNSKVHKWLEYVAKGHSPESATKLASTLNANEEEE